jgi:hypothetical protein
MAIVCHLFATNGQCVDEEKKAKWLMLDASWLLSLNEPYVETNMFYHDNINDQDHYYSFLCHVNHVSESLSN